MDDGDIPGTEAPWWMKIGISVAVFVVASVGSLWGYVSKRDVSLGKAGSDGSAVEILKDITFRLAPATRDDALSMLDGIAAAQILRGVRGADPVDRNALVSQTSLDHAVSSMVTLGLAYSS